ncbi:hypothetical protein [Amycolatopsis sp. CB00013]|uniref:hypothetical protein n=1 Tax=Amycolatopsis sp. CB00013 TaxID=1703945 RepID=UPI00116103A8|nr:hypothetical protein [Amycolatopsis sp. CB00013]
MLILITPPASTVITQDATGKTIAKAAENVFTNLHIDDIGVAIFQAGLTIALFQVLLNRVAEDRFAERVSLSLVDHERSLELAVAKSLSAGRSLELLKLAPQELDQVIMNAVRLRTGNAELGSVIGRKLKTGVFDSNETWRNLVVRAEIFDVERAADTGRKYDYYNVYYQFGYHTTNLLRSRFALKVARWQDEYDKFLREDELGAVWRLPSTGELDDDWNSGFSLSSVSYGGRQLKFQKSDIEREYVTYLPVGDFSDRDDVFVQYSFNAKVVADGNLLSFEVPKPTFSATYSISISVDDIERVRAFDYFGLTRPASIEYSPSLENARIISITVDDWILPKAGTVVVWKRKLSGASALPAEQGGQA